MTTCATSPAYKTVSAEGCELALARRLAGLPRRKHQRGPVQHFSLERHPAAARAACVLSLPDAGRYSARPRLLIFGEDRKKLWNSAAGWGDKRAVRIARRPVALVETMSFHRDKLSHRRKTAVARSPICCITFNPHLSCGGFNERLPINMRWLKGKVQSKHSLFQFMSW